MIAAQAASAPAAVSAASGSAFGGLGRALRWLREKQGRRQYEIADTAGITKAMLSAYETEKQRPTLETLEKLLAALEIDLGDLFDTLQVVNERPKAMRYRDPPAASSLGPEANLRFVLGEAVPAPGEEEAVRDMLGTYLRWLRILRERVLES